MSISSLWSNVRRPMLPTTTFNAIVQWDVAAHRWLLAQNVVQGRQPYYACVAVSSSADATGTYYLYQFSLGNGYPDSPKWAVWPNAFYQTQDNYRRPY